MGFEVRTATLQDAEGIAAIWLAAAPHLVKTAAGIAGELRTSQTQRAFVATEGGAVVGVGKTWLPALDGHSRLSVLVLPRHRRQGIGSALADTVAAAAEGARMLRAVVDDDPTARDFAVRRGFSIGARLSFSRAELTGIPEPPPVPDELQLRTLDQLPDPRLVWQASAAVIGDDPSGLSNIPSYDAWLARDWGHPDHVPELGVALLAGDRVVSFAATSADRERGVIWSDLTGTIPAYRGRGLAKVVKAHALAHCRDAGLHSAHTGNASDNAPMLAVNAWLGYRVAGHQWTAEKTV